MRLSIRDRLTLWYGLVLLVVLIGAGGAVLVLHAHFGLANIDRQLQNRAATVSAEVVQELVEGETLAESVKEVEEIELPETGAAVIDEEGSILVLRDIGLLDADMAVDLPRDSAFTLKSSPFGVRFWPATVVADEHTFRVVVWTSLDDYARERGALLAAVMWGVPLALLIAGAGGWTISLRALRPLADMSAQAGAITSRHPSRLSTPSPHDELGRLAAAFNALLDRLGAALELQRQFMADASHELRTPVSVVRTTTQVTLDREGRTEEEYREALGVIAQQADRMTTLINGMFTLALADAEGRALQTSPFYLDELLEECGRAAARLGQEQGVDVSVTTQGECLFTGDEEHVREMLMNVLDNAVHYARFAGERDGNNASRVDVLLSTADGHARIVIDDTGPGIDASDRERIFDRFVRVGARTSPSGGGLGLAIARWVAEAHGGSVMAGERPGGGGRFVVTLPLASAARG